MQAIYSNKNKKLIDLSPENILVLVDVYVPK